MFLREEFDQQDDAIFVIMYVPLSSFRSSIYIYILSEMMIRLNRWNKCSVINALQIRIGDLSYTHFDKHFQYVSPWTSLQFTTDRYSHICKHMVDWSDHDRFTEINYNSN